MSDNTNSALPLSRLNTSSIKRESEKITIKGNELTGKINTINFVYSQIEGTPTNTSNTNTSNNTTSTQPTQTPTVSEEPTIEPDNSLIIGMVKASDTGKGLEGAGVVVYRIDTSKSSSDETYIGMTFTDKDGKYTFPVEYGDSYEYKIIAHGPLSID
jgi:hypothetical protein